MTSSIKYIATLVLFALFLICIITNVKAQHNKIAFKHLSTTDGLSNFTVLSIAQDHQGFMWFGTMDGLNRFDGKQIKIYREDPDDPNSLGDNYIYSLQSSSDSGLWVGTRLGLFFYNFEYDNFSSIPILDATSAEQSNLIARTFLPEDNFLWIGTNQGLFKYDIVEKEIITIDAINKPSGIINALKKSKDGSIWIGHSQGLTQYKNGEFINATTKINQDLTTAILSIEIDELGKIWAGTQDLKTGLIIFDPKDETHTELSKKQGHLPHNKVNCLFRFRDGKIWAGTTWGLAIINEKTYEAQHLMYESQDPNSISQNSIKRIFQDKNGIIWVSTYSGGVNYFDQKSQFITHISDKYENENSLNFNIVSSIFEDKDKNLWIGTEYGGVNIYDYSNKTFKVLKEDNNKISLISDNIKSIIEDKKGRKFIGTQFGLSIYNPIDDSFFNISDQQGIRGKLSHKTILDFCQDKDGNIWLGIVGNNNSHFQKYDILLDTIIHYYPEKVNFPVLNNAIVNSIVYDESRNIIWAGGDNGLVSFDIKTNKYVINNAFLPAASTLQGIIINDIVIDKNGLLWIGTFGRGLYIMDLNTYALRKIGRQEGLFESSFYALISDNDGNIWTSVNAHLLKIKTPESIENPVVIIEKFGIQEGFPPQQYFRTAACRGSDGKLYFGGDDGFISFNPRDVENIIFHPKVAILDILINGKSLNVKSKSENQFINVAALNNIALTYEQSSFSVKFIAPNYINPDNTWYQYQLSGIHDSWQDLGNVGALNIAKLKAGNYQLKIKASSDPENFSTDFTSINLIVAPPYWRTPLTYFIYIVVILTLLYVFFIISRNWERLAHNLKLEHLEREKEQEFNLQRIKFFTDISHDLRTPLTLILAPLERIVQSNFGNAKISFY